MQKETGKVTPRKRNNKWFGGKIKGTATGMAFVGSGLGALIMSPFLTSIISSSGWRKGYIALAFVYAGLAVVTLLLSCKDPESKGFVRMGETTQESEDVDKLNKNINQINAKKTPEFWLTFFSVTVTTIGSTAWISNAVPYLTQSGIDPTKAATYYSLVLFSLCFGKPLIGWLVDKLGVKTTGIMTPFFFACFVAVLIFLPVWGKITIVFMFLGYMLGAPTITVIPPLMMNGLFGEKDYGANVGFMNTASALGGAFGGQIAARVFDATGTYTGFWIVAILIVASSGVMRIIAWAFNTNRKKRMEAAMNTSNNTKN